MSEVGATIAVAAVIAALIWFGLRLRRTRRQARFRAIADALAFTWVSADDKALRQRLAAFRLFAPVSASGANAVLAGRVHGHPVTVLDYDFGNFVNGGINPYLVLIFEGSPTLPAFWLRPKGSLNSMATGGTGVLAAFPSLRSYVLEGADPEPVLLAHCEGLRSQGRWPSVAGNGSTLIYYEPLRQTPTPEAIRRIVEDGARVREACLL